MKTEAAATVPKSLYALQALRGAAAGLAGRAEAEISASGRRWRVAVRALGRASASDLLGELINNALARAGRSDRLAEARESISAVAVRLLETGFPEARPDPLEELEPQVRADRAEDTAELLAHARRLA